jgi:hypothetical protein
MPKPDPPEVFVAARVAFPEYERSSAYVHQPTRPFRQSSHLAYYRDNRIETIVPAILDMVPRILCTPEGVAALRGISTASRNALSALVAAWSRNEDPHLGQHQGIVLLSAPGDARTIHLQYPISNVIRPGACRRWAFVRGHRYVTLDSLTSARTTNELQAARIVRQAG